MGSQGNISSVAASKLVVSQSRSLLLFPLKSYQVLPDPGYDLLDLESNSTVNPSLTILGPLEEATNLLALV